MRDYIIIRSLQEGLYSVRREVVYSIFIESDVPIKLFWLIEMCLNERYSEVSTGEYFSDSFPIQNGLKQGDVLLLLLSNVTLEYAVRNVREHYVGLKSNEKHQLLAYADDACLREHATKL
jgi:hypothetical protein